MSSDEKRVLAPNEALLGAIFPQSKPVNTTILSQTHEACTFIAHFDGSDESGPLNGAVVVRLEIAKNRLRTISALQQIAALSIPELIPAVLQNGTVRATGEKELEFSISVFVVDTVTLEAVWDDLTEDQQSKIVDKVLSVMMKLQAIDLADKSVQKILNTGMSDLSKTFGSGDGVSFDLNIPLGGPETGFFEDMPGLLTGIIAYNDQSENLRLSFENEPRDHGVIIASTFEGIPDVYIKRQELASLRQRVVFCHNDLEPRNILVRPVHSGDDSVQYEVATIIDWEMAGFFPFAYEYCMKDAFLGCENLCFTWYALFKERTAALFPIMQLSEPEKLFIEAMDRILQARNKEQTTNVGALFRKKWIEREQLVPGEFLWSGWIRRLDATAVKTYGKEDNKLLEEEILKELGLL